MTNQYRSSYASNSSWNWCDCFYNRLCFLKVYISAKLAFSIYIDTYINNNLSFSQICIIYYACTSCCYDNNVCLFYNRRHVHSSCMAYSNCCVFLDQHHGRWLSYYQASADNNGSLSCTVNAIVVQNLHTC